MEVCWKTNKLPLVFLSNNFAEDLSLQGAEQILLYGKGKLSGKEVMLVDPKSVLSEWCRLKKPCNQKRLNWSG